ncbi:MAG: hypothetical protein U0800_03970 [Isosphaeraceae bacterium]
MRFGQGRRAVLTLWAAGLFATLGMASTARATDWFGDWHTIPRETLALDYRTGQPMQAPAIPFGHYAKESLGSRAAGYINGAVYGAKAGLMGKLSAAHALCGKCGGKGCGSCGGCGMASKEVCGDAGCGLCAKKGSVMPTSLGCGDGKCGLGHAFVGNGGLPVASPQAPCVAPSSQACVKGGKCLPGPIVKAGCGPMGCVDPGDPCGGDPGCGIGLGGCGACGGKGCGLCLGAGKGKLKSLLGVPHAVVAKAFHIGEIKYFNGPGGPVPLTPGYVPYVVTTRSPRDFFAFPPMGNGVQPDY